MKSRGYWTYERCKEIVSKYKTKKDLYKNDGSVYVTITRNKWFDLIENLEISTNDIFKRLIYVYEFSDNHCYIGLTYNIEKRNKQHLGLSKGENSQVFKHMSKYGIKPKLVIKSDKIYVNDGTWIDINGSYRPATRTFVIVTTGKRNRAGVYQYMPDGKVNDITATVTH